MLRTRAFVSLSVAALLAALATQSAGPVAAHPQRGFQPPMGPQSGPGEEIKLLDQFDR